MSRTEVSKIFNVSYETVRNWERRGILVVDYVSPTGRFFYNEEQINSLYEKQKVSHDKK